TPPGRAPGERRSISRGCEEVPLRRAGGGSAGTRPSILSYYRSRDSSRHGLRASSSPRWSGGTRLAILTRPRRCSNRLPGPTLIGTPTARPAPDSVRDDSKPDDVVVIGRCPAGPLGDAAMTRLVQERTPADDAARAAGGA